jgi:membrane-associated protease RseP (regulator of RpoE activity)
MSSVPHPGPSRRAVVLALPLAALALLAVVLFLVLGSTTPSAETPGPQLAPTAPADPGCVQLRGPC